MWYLKNAQGEITYLKPNKSLIVSRKEGHDIVLRNDASISKLHASITVRPKVNFKNHEPSSTVIVQDTTSKYGTFIIDSNNRQRKITPGDHELTAKDRVKFGLLHHIFTLHYVPLITSTSTLNNNEKTQLRNIIDTVDGVIVEEWKEYCTHLTVSNVTLTDQVAHALAFGTPIVKLEYWHAVAQSVEKNEELPDAANFVPTINEGLINRESVSLKANAERKVLFKNLFFVCFSVSQYSLKDIIKCAGGRLRLFKEGVFDPNQLFSDNIILLQVASDTSQLSQGFITLYDSIQQRLQKKKLRLIPESEIFLAILYCSIEKYCNPKFDFRRLISLSERNKNRDPLSSTVLAPDTEDILSTTKNHPDVIINESLLSSEQTEERESRNLLKDKSSFGRNQTVDNAKESTPSALGNKKILERQSFGSAESSRDGVLMIDETRSSFESDSNDSSIKRRDIVNEFDEPVNTWKISVSQNTSRRFNLQSKLQPLKVTQKENSGESEARTQNSNRILDANFFSNPFTSKKSRDFESEENSALKRFKNMSDQKSKEKSLQREVILETKARKASGSTSANDAKKMPKRARIDEGEEEEDMFAFVNEGAAKRKKNLRQNDGADLFELLEDPNAANSYQEENIFEKEVNAVQRFQNKRRRCSSLSSNDSSIEEEKPQVKVERPDSDDEVDHAPLIRCKKELDSSMNETCKSSIVPLLRSDIDLTLDSTTGNSKTFIKVYTLIPQQRVKLKNMYVWKSQEETVRYESHEELTSSEDDNDEFRFFDKEVPKKRRGRK